MNDVLFLGNTEALLAEQVPTLPTLGTDFTVPLVTTHIIDRPSHALDVQMAHLQC